MKSDILVVESTFALEDFANISPKSSRTWRGIDRICRYYAVTHVQDVFLDNIAVHKLSLISRVTHSRVFVNRRTSFCNMVMIIMVNYSLSTNILMKPQVSSNSMSSFI